MYLDARDNPVIDNISFIHIFRKINPIGCSEINNQNRKNTYVKSRTVCSGEKFGSSSVFTNQCSDEKLIL